MDELQLLLLNELTSHVDRKQVVDVCCAEWFDEVKVKVTVELF